MEQKTVTQAALGMRFPTHSESLYRALALVVERNGVLRTDERWVHDALRPLINDGFLKVEGNIISVAMDFEQVLISMATRLDDQRFADLHTRYRQSLVDEAEAISHGMSRDIHDRINALHSTDARIQFLAQLLTEQSAAINKLLEDVRSVSATLVEMDTALSALEGCVYSDALLEKKQQ